MAAETPDPQSQANAAKLAKLRAMVDAGIDNPAARVQPKRLAGALDKIEAQSPRAEWRAEWLEARILVNCLHKLRASRTCQMLNELRDIYTNARNPEAFDAYNDIIMRALYPDYISPNGYKRSLADVVEGDVWDGLREACELVESLGYPVFLNSGTLLGVVRSGGLIAHDYDVDLALILNSTDARSAALEWEALRRMLLETGRTDPEDQFDEFPEIIKLRPIDGLHVDLFPGWSEDGKIYVYPHTCGELDVAQVLPLIDAPIKGLRLPAEPEQMLALNYGEGWRVPDPLFRFDWRTAKIRFSAFRDAVEAARS